MNYELAKKLKEAGFPQFWPKPDFLEMKDAMIVHDVYSKYPQEFNPYRPTLSELIEACGDDFEMLRKIFHYPNGVFLHWFAECTNKKGICTEGFTPEEAVANVWLVLNKKS